MKYGIQLLVLVISVGFNSNAISNDDLDNSAIAMSYVCWRLADEAGFNGDSDLFAKAINLVRSSPEFTMQHHIEYIAYATRRTGQFNESEKAKLYEYGCLEPLENIKRFDKQGMLE